MSKAGFVMLAHKYDENKHGVGGWFASEKLDGHRAIWIPGTRGIPKKDVPFANHEKDDRYVKEPTSTGLWSRMGNVIHAPDWFLDQLPNLFLDGELFTYRGTGGRQALSSTIRKLVPDEDEWSRVKYHVFDIPSPEALLGDRKIDELHFKKEFKGALRWWEKLHVALLHRTAPDTRFESTVFLLDKFMKTRGANVVVHKQFQLAYQTSLARAQLSDILLQVSTLEGEGLMLREQSSVWTPERSWKLLKVKPLDDAEGTVTGYVTGKETNKGSKLLGMMGALVLSFNGKRLELAGFTDGERKLALVTGACLADAQDAESWARDNPGKEVPSWIEAPEFPRGSSVTFKYRDLTAGGLPNEARYFRKRTPE